MLSLPPLAALQGAVRSDPTSAVLLAPYTAFVLAYDLPWAYRLWRVNPGTAGNVHEPRLHGVGVNFLATLHKLAAEQHAALTVRGFLPVREAAPRPLRPGRPPARPH